MRKPNSKGGVRLGFMLRVGEAGGDFHSIARRRIVAASLYRWPKAGAVLAQPWYFIAMVMYPRFQAPCQLLALAPPLPLLVACTCRGGGRLAPRSTNRTEGKYRRCEIEVAGLAGNPRLVRQPTHDCGNHTHVNAGSGSSASCQERISPYRITTIKGRRLPKAGFPSCHSWLESIRRVMLCGC